MNRFDDLAREVLVQIDLKRNQTYDYADHTLACDEDVDGSICVCPVDLALLLDDLADAVRHLVWLAQLDDARVPSC
jgi:hypothetical protein